MRRPVKVDPPHTQAAFVDVKTGLLTPHGRKIVSFLRDRTGGDDDEVFRALGVGFTSITQVNQVNQRVDDVAAQAASALSAVAGLRGDPRLDDAVAALALAVTALAQVQARASGETEKRLADQERVISSLGGRVTKAQQAVQTQLDSIDRGAVEGQRIQAAFTQRMGAERLVIDQDIETIDTELEDRAKAALSATAPALYDSVTGVFSLNDSLTSLGTTTTAADKSYYTTTLNTWASYDLTAFGRSVSALADASAGRTLFGLVIGTNVQAYDADLTTWAGITPGTGVAAALAVNVGSAGAFVAFNGAGGTPSSLTLTNATGLPVSGITASTSTAIGVGSVELGHASDTTLARSSAGNVTIEGNLIYRAGGTDVPVADGGTGASSAAAAATNLGLGTASSVTFGNLDIASGGRIVTPSIRVEGTAPVVNVKDTDSTAATSIGTIGGRDSTNAQTWRIGRPFGDGNLWVENDGGTIYIARAIAGSAVITVTSGVADITGELRCDTLRIDATPTAAAVTQSHHVPISINGTTYKLLLAS